MQRILIVMGIIILLLGMAWPWISRIGLGRLPGDIVVEREHFRFYFPVVTSLLLSLIASLVLWLLRK